MNLLQIQLENERFEHALRYVHNSSVSIKQLTTTELGHLNKMLTGDQDEPWRYNEAHVLIPTGTTKRISVFQNPTTKARDILSTAYHVLKNDPPATCSINAAFYLYTELVQAHLFNDANRRTAVLGVIWLLDSNGLKIDAHKLIKIPIGDLHNSEDMTRLKQKIIDLL